MACWNAKLWSKINNDNDVNTDVKFKTINLP